MEKYHGNTVEYWKQNAEEDYLTTPISVLKYITVLEKQAEQLRKHVVMSSGIAFAEWVDWNKYERFEGRRDLWYDKKSSYTNLPPIKTTEDLLSGKTGIEF